MSIIRVGTTKKYAAGWATAFEGKKAKKSSSSAKSSKARKAKK